MASILVVDDDPQVCTLISAMLGMVGHSIVVNHSGEEALDECRQRGAGAFDLVISDMVMPGMTGLELVTTLSSTGLVKRTVLMSGYTGAVPFEEIRLPPRAAFLAKPFLMDELITAVREQLAQLENAA